MTDKNEIKATTKTMKGDKYFFASYLNMARHNIYLNIVDIALRIGATPPNSDDNIFCNAVFDKLTNLKKPEVSVKLQELLRKKFPFLESLMVDYLYHFVEIKGATISDANPEDYVGLFKWLFKQVNELRNDFTHEYKEVKDFDEILLKSLKNIYDASVYKTKDQFGFTDVETKHLIRRMANPVRKAKPKVIEIPNFKFAFEKDNKITENGLAFFICLFLEKKYAYLFLNQLKDFKGGKGRNARATFETYCAYHIKMPKLKIESEAQESLLYMDMLNELKRCPSNLYEHLEEKEQARFKIKIEENNKDGLDPEATLKRHDDRFPYFFMRYWDETKAFDRLRFCFDLGNYHFDVYDKEIGGEMRIRRLTKKLLSFGRFQDFSLEKTKENYPNLVKPSNEVAEDSKEKYIVETVPHYHIDDSNIAIKIIENRATEQPYPSLTKASAKGMPYSTAPDVLISQYELLPMAFYSFLKRENGVSVGTQTIIIQHYNRVRAFFEYLSKGGTVPTNDEIILDEWLRKNYNGLTINQIPGELKTGILQRKTKNFDDSAAEKIKGMIEHSERRLKRLDRDLDTTERKNKIGRSEHREIKSGVLADFIAEDLMRFQATLEGNKGKATGMTYQVLQAKIAFYGGNKKELKIIFKDCNLINAPNEHPFLKELDYENYFGIIEFYKAYLNKRIEYLKRCQAAKQYDNYFWLHLNKAKRRKEVDFVMKTAQNYLSKESSLPVYFPRGIFQEEIKQFLIKNCKSEQLRELLTNAERANTTFMIQKYFELELNDASQPFYGLKRSYEIFDKFSDKRQGKALFTPLEKVYYTTEGFTNELKDVKKWVKQQKQDKSNAEKSKKQKEIIANSITSKEKALIDFEKNEKALRHEKASDMMLFLIIKDLMKQSGDATLIENIASMKLKDIAPDSERGILATQIPFARNFTFNSYDEKGNPNKDDKITKKIVQNDLKIKNFGDFRKFVKDRRLPNLMFYITAEAIERKGLEKELEQYDVARIEIFKAIADFERVAYKRYKHKITNQNREHSDILDAFCADYPQFAPIKSQVLAVRNAFSHNQYPLHSIWQGDKPNDINVANFLKEKTINYYKSFVNVLKNQ